jgi:type II secretory pathway pseudopilin PulG
MDRGHSLPELAVALLLAALLLPAGVAGLRAAADRVAVASVREEVAALLVQTRAEARMRGGASLLIGADPLTLHLIAGSDTLHAADPQHRTGVYRLPPPGSEALRPLRIEYDALGVGRVASATVRLGRGRARGVLTISALGRVVR